VLEICTSCNGALVDPVEKSLMSYALWLFCLW